MCAWDRRATRDAAPELTALAPVLLSVLPARSPESRQILEALSASRGLLHDTAAFAAELHLGSRYRVARLLRRESLPQLEELAAWVRVIRWLLAWQGHSSSLSHIALDDGLETSVCSRTVRRCTGVTWTEARSRGPEWAVTLLAERCATLAQRRGLAVRARSGARAG
jgi:hypothetical protein